MFTAQTTPGQTIFTRNTFAPRLGVSYDMSGQGNTVLKGFYGRFYYNYADAFTNLNPGGSNFKTFRFNDLNGNRRYDGPQELGTLVSSSGGTSTTVDPTLKTPYADEYDLSIERQFWGESSVRVAYVRKVTQNEFNRAIDIARLGRFTVPVTVPVTLRDFVSGVTGVQNLSLMDLPDSPTPVNQFVNLPDGSDKYDTVQFAFNKRFRTGLFIQSSYDYQWRDELRRADSISGSPLTSDPMATGFFLNPNPAISNRQQTTNWQGRLIGRYVFPYDVGMAANLRV